MFGYTATSKNLLMMENNGDESRILPLFPRDFLHALPKPTNHLDNEYYFGSSDGLNHVYTRLPPIPDSREEDDIVEEMVLQTFTHPDNQTTRWSKYSSYYFILIF